MEIYDKMIRFIDVNLVYCLVPMILTISLIQVIFKNRFKTRQLFNLIRWFIIAYTIVTIMYHIFGMITLPAEITYPSRAGGPYWFAYWTMLLSATLLPLTLLYKKLATKSLYILLIAVFMKIGWYYERFIIIVSGYGRDYPASWPDADTAPMTEFLIIIFTQGFILAILLLGIVEFTERQKDIDISNSPPIIDEHQSLDS